MGICKDKRTITLKLAPILVLEPIMMDKFRVKVYIRKITDCAVKYESLLDHFDSKIYDFSGRNCFTSLYFQSVYFKIHLHPDCYAMCRLKPPTRVDIFK